MLPDIIHHIIFLYCFITKTTVLNLQSLFLTYYNLVSLFYCVLCCLQYNIISLSGIIIVRLTIYLWKGGRGQGAALTHKYLSVIIFAENNGSPLQQFRLWALFLSACVYAHWVRVSSMCKISLFLEIKVCFHTHTGLHLRGTDTCLTWIRMSGRFKRFACTTYLIIIFCDLKYLCERAGKRLLICHRNNDM